MSVKVMSRVWSHGPERQADCFVLLALADYANDDGECWPSIAGIATKVRMSARGVQKIVRSLTAEGWLSVEIGVGRRGCNLYRIREPEPRTTFIPEPHASRTEASTPPNHKTAVPEPRSPEPSRTIIEPSEEKNTEVDAEFDRIWQIYPRKVGKGDARKAWIKARAKAPSDVIARAIAQFARAVSGTEPRFIPHLSKWLNGERWLDDQRDAANRPRASTEDLSSLATITAADDLDRLWGPLPKAIEQ